MSFSRRRMLAPVCVAVATLALSACGGGHHKAVVTPSATPTPTPTPTPSSSTPAAFSGNPFTGAAKASANPVVAVKIDDTANGRPPVNIDKADMVYVEQVEGGLTRLLAIYNTSLPTVEAVRSTRASDPELVEQFGPIAYAASGGAPNPLEVLRHSPLKASINDAGGPGFARDSNREAPYNLTANLALVGQALHGPKAKSIGLTFGFADLSHAPLATNVNTVVGSTGVQFTWDFGTNRYVRRIGGAVETAADGRAVSTPNVIVQYCAVTPYPQDVDVVGNVSKYTHTLGVGHVVVFRNGRRVDGSWSRKTATSPTTLTDKAGHAIPLSPGGEWIILVADGAPLTS
jgi:DUF3048 family protein